MTKLTSEGLKTPSPRLFIVHAAEDEWFVSGFLVPSVGLPKEEVLLSTKLELGAPIVEAIASGALSPVTVVVMSPSFLECPWATFANQLATHQSVERAKDGGLAVVPAKLVDCDLPLYSAFNVLLDFRAHERWENEAARLREKLAAPEPECAVVRCPYPGMLAFEENAAADFYGRESEVLQALAYVEAGARELYVIGSSGSGKSSLVAAGIFPKLQRAVEHGGARYLMRQMRPGSDPLATLASALEVTAAAEISVEWQSAVGRLLARHPEHQRLLLFVDQLEELFTTSKAAVRAAFEQALLQLREDARVMMVLTLRADFYGELLNSALWEGSGRTPMRLDVTPLRGALLRNAIEKPAGRLGVYFEPVLVERLLQEVKHEVGALPLLQDALVQLWRERTRGMIRLADYEGISTEEQTGLAARVQYRADAALQELTDVQQQLARRVLLRMVQFSEGALVTRRQQTRAALAAAGDVEVEVDAVIHHLVERRLVTTSEGESPEGWAARVDLSHEVLLTAWPTLKGWIQTRCEDEQRRRVLEGKATEWVRSGRGQTRLLDAEELAEVHAWLTQEMARELGPSEQALALVAASEVAENEKASTLAALARQRRQAEEARAEAELQRERSRREQEQERITARHRLTQVSLVGLTVFSVVASGLGLFLWQKWGEAREQREEAREQREEARQQRKATEEQLARNLVEQARRLLLEHSKPTLAIPFLQKAIALGANGSMLRTVLMTLRRYVWRVTFFHGDAVRFAAFSPDGARMVTASEDKTARIWDVATGRPVSEPLEHQGTVLSAAFSPDGARVVTASDDKTARIWDVATGRAVGVPLQHRRLVFSAAFSSDGIRIVTASADYTAQIWDVATGRPLAVPLEHRGPVTSAVFSPDGALVVTISADSTARIWDVATGHPLGVPLEHSASVMSAAFSPDSTRIITASRDKIVRIWNVATGRRLSLPWEGQRPIWGIAFSSDNARVVTVNEDRITRVLDVVTGRPVGRPLNHQTEIFSAAFSPDGTRLVTVSEDKGARVWDVATGQPLGPFLEHQGSVWNPTFSPDGSRIVTAIDNAARVWDVARGRPLDGSLKHQGRVTSVAFSPDSARVVTIEADPAQILDVGTSAVAAPVDRTARIWDVATGLSLGAPLRQRGWISSAVFSPDGARVIVSVDQTAQIWDVATGRRLGVPLNHYGWVTNAAFSPDGARVVTGADDTAQVWDVATGRRLGAPLNHYGGVTAAAFNPDSTRVVTASTDHTARVWDVATGRLLGAPLKHQGWVMSAAFSPDGSRIVTASKDKTARIWDVATGQLLGTPLEHQGGVTSVAFSPDGARIITGSMIGNKQNTARVWDVATGQPLGVSMEHQGEVTSATFSPDGILVVTTRADQTARVWDVATGQPLSVQLEHQGWVWRAAFSPDGARIITASEDHTAQIWDIAETGSLATWSKQAERCIALPSEGFPSVRCELASYP